MSRFGLHILPDAESDIREAFLWYHERSPIAAYAFRTELFTAIDQLATDALIWPQDKDAIRSYILRHFPYKVFYEVQKDMVTILAVAHHRRKPGYWRER